MYLYIFFAEGYSCEYDFKLEYIVAIFFKGKLDCGVTVSKVLLKMVALKDKIRRKKYVFMKDNLIKILAETSILRIVKNIFLYYIFLLLFYCL